MELFYFLPDKSKITFIEAIKIVNKMLPKDKIRFYHTVEENTDKKNIRFLLIVDHAEILIDLGKVWNQLEGSYGVDNIFISCKEIVRKYAHKQESDKQLRQSIKKLILLFMLIAFLLAAFLFLYLIKVMAIPF